jgi:hypothetical protein
VLVHDGLSLAAGRYFRERGDVQEYRHAELGSFTVPGLVPRGHDGAGLNAFRAPAVGEDNAWLSDQIKAER